MRIVGTRAIGRGSASRGMTAPGVSRKAATAHNEVVLTGERDDDSILYDAAAADVARASERSPAEVLSDREPGYGWLCGGGSCANVDLVGS